MNKKTKFDLEDVLLTPEVTTTIQSRAKDVDPYYKDARRVDNFYLPIYNAPMDRVISRNNEHVFISNRINPVQTRGLNPVFQNTIHSLSLIEIKDLFSTGRIENNGRYLIDMANGHMKSLLDFVKDFKETYPDIFLMVGNIANPETYKVLSDAGADAIRINVGSGGNCSTSLNTGVGYGVASLIVECKEISNGLSNPAQIVADGGMRTYADVIKALALGADYVMIGGLFNKTIESAGDNYLFNCIKVSQKTAERLFKLGLPIYKSMRGMSTQEVQKDWGKRVLRASEGLVTRNKVTGSMSKWISEFDEYLRSSMSYCGATNLEEFIGQARYTIISENVKRRINK